MNVAIPPEFVRFARDRVEAGVVSSEEEAVAIVLRDYLTRLDELRALIDEGVRSGPAKPYDADAVKQGIQDALSGHARR